MLLWPDSDNLVFFIKHYCIYFDFTTLLVFLYSWFRSNSKYFTVSVKTFLANDVTLVTSYRYCQSLKINDTRVGCTGK